MLLSQDCLESEREEEYQSWSEARRFFNEDALLLDLAIYFFKTIIGFRFLKNRGRVANSLVLLFNSENKTDRASVEKFLRDDTPSGVATYQTFCQQHNGRDFQEITHGIKHANNILMCAAKKANVNLVGFLSKREDFVNVRDNYNQNALSFAATSDGPIEKVFECIKILFKAGVRDDLCEGKLDKKKTLKEQHTQEGYLKNAEFHGSTPLGKLIITWKHIAQNVASYQTDDGEEHIFRISRLTQLFLLYHSPCIVDGWSFGNIDLLIAKGEIVSFPDMQTEISILKMFKVETEKATLLFKAKYSEASLFYQIPSEVAHLIFLSWQDEASLLQQTIEMLPLPVDTLTIPPACAQQ